MTLLKDSPQVRILKCVLLQADEDQLNRLLDGSETVTAAAIKVKYQILLMCCLMSKTNGNEILLNGVCRMFWRATTQLH